MRLSFRFLVGFASLSAIYSIYYSISRPYFGRDLYGEKFLIYLVGAEYIPVMISFLVGALGDYYGRKKVLHISYLGLIPLSLLFIIKEMRLTAALVSSFSFFINLAYMIGLSSVLENRREVGKTYSLVGIANGIGWALGSTTAWGMYLRLNEWLFSASLASIYCIGIYCMKSGYSGKDRELDSRITIGLRETYSGLKSLIPVFLLTYIGTAIGSNVNALILDEKLSEFMSSKFDIDMNPRVFYGLFYAGLPVVFGLPLRVLAGKLIDRGIHMEVFTISVLAYLIIFTVLPILPPILFLIVWLVPIYPFFDTSMYAISSRRTKSHEASVSGLLWTIYSVAGACLIALNTLNRYGDFRFYLFMMTISLSLSFVFLVREIVRGKNESLTTSH